MLDEAAQSRLARFIADEAGAETAAIVALAPLAGGAVREHWRLRVDIAGGAHHGRHDLVLRMDGASALGMGLDLGHEFALLRVLADAGLKVPAPLFCAADRRVIGRKFHLTRELPGCGDPAALVAGAPREALAEALGRRLGELHRIVPERPELAFLGAPPADAAAARLDDYRCRLDALGEARPAAEWGMRWLRRHMPPPAPPVLCHGDFRTGNYLVADGALAGVLDWEFAGWSDGHEDLGWFCSRCWRFGADAWEAGGIGSRASLVRGYEAASGRRIELSRLRYWETMAALRWLVIALLQRDRVLVQGERSLDLALTGRRAAECELELLRLSAEP